MADKLEILITAKDQASDVLSGIGGSLTRVGGLLTGAIAGGAAAAIGAVVGLGAAAFDSASDMKDAMNQMQAQLGLTGAEAKELGGVVKEVFRNNFGESIEDVGASVATVSQKLRDLGVTAPGDIQEITESALALREVFGFEVSESMESVRALMDNFGITGQQALDLITSGMQDIPAFAADGLDTINEYAGVFADAGFSAAQMYAIMESGAATGVLGTDKIADSIKEMTIRLNEGGDEVSAAFSTIGLSFSEVRASVASGERDWAQYFRRIVDGINDIEDPIERSAAQVAIFGTMAEDMGVSFTEGLTAAGTLMADFEGAADSLNVKYDSLGKFFEGMWRRVQVAIMPVGEALLYVANLIMPSVEQAFAWFENGLIPIVEAASYAFEVFAANLIRGANPIMALNWGLSEFFKSLGIASEATGNITTQIWFFYQDVLKAKEAVLEFVTPIAKWIAEFVSWKDVLVVLGGAIAAVVIPAIISIATAIGPILLAVGAAIAVVALLRNAWENNWGGIRDKVQEVIDFIVPFVNNAISSIRQWWEDNWEGIQAKVQSVIDFIVPFLNNAINNIRQWWAANGQQIIANVRDAWNNIVSAISNTIQEIRAFILDFLGQVEAWWSTHGETVIATVTGFINQIRTEIENGLALIVSLWENNFGGIQDKVQAVSDFVLPIIQSVFAGEIPAVFEDAQSRISEVWDAIWSVLGPIVESVRATLEPTIQNMMANINESMASFQPAIEAFKGLWQSLAPLLQGVAAIVGGIVVAAFGVLVGIINGVINAINPLIQTFAGLLTSVINIFTNIARFFTGFFDIVIGLFTGNQQRIEQGWSAMGQNIVGLVQNLVNGIVNLIKGLGATLSALVSGLIDGIVGFFTGLYNTLVGNSIIPDMVAGIINSFMGMVNNVLSLIGGFITDFVQNITTWASNVLTKVAGFVIDFVVKMGDLRDDVIAAIGEFISETLQIIGQWVIDFLQFLSGLKNDAVTFIRNMITDMISLLRDNDWAQIGRNMIEGILNGLINAQYMIMDWITNLAQSILEGILNFFSTPFSGQSLPQFANQSVLPFPTNPFPAVVGGNEHHVHYNLTVNSNQNSDDIAQDFWMMRAFG